MAFTRTQPLPDRAHPALVVGLGVAIALVVAALAAPWFQAKYRRTRDVPSLAGVAQTLKRCLQNPAAWDAMIADPANPPGLRCVRDPAGCASDRPIPLAHILAASGRFCVPGYDLSNAAHGLTADGIRCDGFREAGNAKCPYRLEVSWVPHCLGNAKSCANPVETLIFGLAYRNDSALAGSTPLFGDGVTRAGFGDGQTLAVPRGRETNHETVVIGEAAPSGIPGGPCKAGRVPTRRNMNLVVTDATGRAATAVDGSFYLRRGKYECRLSTPGFKVGAFRSFVVDLDRNRFLMATSDEYSSSALIAAQTRAVGYTRLELNAPNTHLAVFQFCGEEAGGSPEVKNLALGVPAGLGPELYATLDCAVVPEELL